MTYRISGAEFQVLLELLRDHKDHLTTDQRARLSDDPDDLLHDLLGQDIGSVWVELPDGPLQ